MLILAAAYVVNYLDNILLLIPFVPCRPVYETANFFLLGRILYYVPHLSPIHPGRVVTTFVGIGAIVESLTANGAVRITNNKLSKAQQNVGHTLIKASLILQLVIMILFVSLAAKFQKNCLREGITSKKLHTPLYVLYTSCVLITCRTIYRTVEYFAAANLSTRTVTNLDQLSPLIKVEAYFYCFEAMFMLANTALLNGFYPAKYLPRSTKIYLNKDGVEIEGPGYKDNRHFLVTLFDPFDIVGLVRGRDRETRFWANQSEGTPLTPTGAHQAQV